MLQLKNISKSFGSIRAVAGVSLAIKSRAITILTGADGAGKSTLFKIVVGLVRADSGQILLDGEPIGRDYSRINRITGYMPERFSLYPDLSVEENMNFFADIYRVPHRRREELKARLLSRTGMMPFKKRRAGALSGGMKQKLALSTILLASPDIIILDEPTTGVDPLSRIEFFEIIEELKQSGKTILISTPYLDEAERGDHIVFIKGGKILTEDSIAHLKESFPARLFRILPRDNIFAVLNRLQEIEALKENVYIRGKYIKFSQTGDTAFPAHIPVREMKEESPTLEDIFIYYERRSRQDRESV
jgi:ABC-2 type transport system ATP-binding protein